MTKDDLRDKMIDYCGTLKISIQYHLIHTVITSSLYKSDKSVNKCVKGVVPFEDMATSDTVT